MDAFGGSDGRDDSPDAVPHWGGTNREQRGRKRRAPIDLTVCPKRRRALLGHWRFSCDGTDTAFFQIIVETLLPTLRKRRVEEQQAREARQALQRARLITVSRHEMIGYLFSWSNRGAVYYLAVREEDTLTARLDQSQWQFGKSKEEKYALSTRRQPKPREIPEINSEKLSKTA